MNSRLRAALRTRLSLTLLFLAGLWLSLQPAYAQTKQVFAHYMVAMRDYGSSVEGYKRDIQDAQAYGIDGFALNEGDWDQPTKTNYVDDTANIFEAARQLGTGFKLFFSIDGAGSAFTATETINIVEAYANHPNYFKYNNRPFLSTFGGEGANAEA